jgi:hypothetical protein
MGPATFGNDSPQHTTTIAERVKVTNSVNSSVLKAWDLSDDEPCLGDADMNERLDLKAVAPKPPVTGRSC